jgi:hypothetical protein
LIIKYLKTKRLSEIAAEEENSVEKESEDFNNDEDINSLKKSINLIKSEERWKN